MPKIGGLLITIPKAVRYSRARERWAPPCCRRFAARSAFPSKRLDTDPLYSYTIFIRKLADLRPAKRQASGRCPDIERHKTAEYQNVRENVRGEYPHSPFFEINSRAVLRQNRGILENSIQGQNSKTIRRCEMPPGRGCTKNEIQRSRNCWRNNNVHQI